jgi:hypothetical protein
VRAHRIKCDLMIERETPGDRVAEIQQACELVQRLLLRERSAQP